MLRQKSPRLAAAFVVTISAGCGGASANSDQHDDVPHTNRVMSGFVKGNDGQCYIEIFANPPYREPADCETQQPLKKTETAPVKPPEKPVAVDSKLPDAPAGWSVEKNPDGSCTAYAPLPPCPQGSFCNPPPPQQVKCPLEMPKTSADPTAM
jgi:hypothetical protein